MESMSRKRTLKPYWEMTLEELRESTKHFDEEFVADKSRPLTQAERALWKKLRAQPPVATDGVGRKTIAVRLERTLLDRCSAMAKKKRISRDAVIARALRTYLAGNQC
jgi:hypothetical protein